MGKIFLAYCLFIPNIIGIFVAQTTKCDLYGYER